MTQTIYNATRQPVTIDPLDAAMNPERPASLDRVSFGEVAVLDAYFCCLEKGVGKRVFDETHDDPTKRVTAIKISIMVPKRDGGEFPIDQDCTDFSKEWQKITLPSLRKLNLTLKQLKGMFVQVKRTPTGETYTSKDGAVRDRTGLEFVATFPDRAAMTAAADLFFTPRSQRSDAPVQADDSAPLGGMPPVATPAAAAPLPAGDDSMRAYALQILPALWVAAKQDATAFLAMISANPMIAKYFDSQSPEVLALTNALPF